MPRDMSIIAEGTFPSRPEHASVARRIWRAAAALALALEVRGERINLLSLDDRTLKDLGFNRGEAYAEAYRSFWDIPVDRLRR